jgi:tetratricopeptide (TPR) repeat protein
MSENLLKKAQAEFANNNFLKSISLCRKVIKKHPESLNAHKVLATCLVKLERFKEAEITVKKAMSLDKDKDDSLTHLLGCIYTSLEMYDKSLNLLEALFNKTGDPKVLLNIGLNLQSLGHFQDAKDVFLKFLEFDPENIMAQLNLSIILLYFKEFEVAWTLHHSRLQTPEILDKVHWYGQQWQGESLINKRVLIWPEQGVGDHFLYTSCFDEAISDALHCYVVCDERFKSLYQANYPDATIITDVELYALNVSPFNIDVQILAGSLTYLYRASLNDFSRQKDLQIPEKSIKEKGLRLSSKKLRVGISWFHGRENDGNSFSMNLEELLPVLQIENIEWVNLQFGNWQKEVLALNKKHNIALSFWPDSSAAGDFEQYGALIKNLDLVISPSNAAFMYAARLGVKSWTFNPISDYHFGEDTDKSPWFNDVKQFCSSNDDNWENVVNSIKAEVHALLESRE